MKYAFMSFSTPELSFTEMIDAAKRFGYDGVEIRIDSDHAHGLEPSIDKSLRQKAREQASEAGIEICCIATSSKFADPSNKEETQTETHAAIELAHDLGAPCIRVFGGSFPESMDREEAVSYMSGSLLELADFAQEQRVTVCLETHDSWCNPEHVAQVIKKCNHPFIQVNCDIMHPVRRGNATMDQAFDVLGPFIRHVHFHDGTGYDKLEMVPVGKGAIDHKTALKRLMDIDYQGFLSGEWIKWEPWEEHLPRELAQMKEYEKQLREGR